MRGGKKGIKIQQDQACKETTIKTLVKLFPFRWDIYSHVWDHDGFAALTFIN